MTAASLTRLGACALAAALLPLGSGAGWASSCNREVVSRIRFPAGGVCWSYRGRATTFVGDFGAGQTVTVQMSGESASWDPATNKVVTSWAPRSPSVSGPGKFFATGSGNDGVLRFRTGRAGSYRINFSPCAMWGGLGQVQVCAR